MERITAFKQELSSTLSRKIIDNIVESVLSFPDDFPILFSLIKDENEKVSWRAAWACEKLCNQYPELFMGKRSELRELSMRTKHEGTKRLILSILYKLPVDKPISIEFLNACMDWMFSPKESIAVQSLSIKLSYQQCMAEPDLLPELKVYLEHVELDYYSKAIETTVKNVLKRLNKKSKVITHKNQNDF